MSSLIRKGGAPKFKPKAPQGRRPVGATPTPSAPSSSRQSLDRQSETPGPPARPPTPPLITIAPPANVTEPLKHQIPLVEAFTTVQNVAQETIVGDTRGFVAEPLLEEGLEVYQYAQTADSCQQAHNLTSDEALQSRNYAPLNPEVSKRATLAVEKPPLVTTNTAQYVEPVARVSQDALAAGDTSLSMLTTGESDQDAQLLSNARLLSDNASEILNVPTPQKQARRPAKRRRIVENGIEIMQSIEARNSKSRQSNRRKKGPKGLQDLNQKMGREPTPEDAEEQVVDHTTMKMSELTKDLRVGRKFSRHAELKKRDIEVRIKAKFAAKFSDLDPALPHQVEGASQSAPRELPPAETSSRPQMRIVDGQIVIDDASLVVDRHAIAANATEELEEVEEDDFTRITTSGTYMKKEKKIGWAMDDEEKFYMGLRMFGTDFEMISQMFPNRSRKQVKLKFVKDQREDPQRIANALSEEPIGIDLEEYKSHTGLEYQEVADIEAEQAQRVEEHKAHERSIQAEADETSRQKRAEIQSRVPGASGAVAEAATATVTHASCGAESAKENEPNSRGGAVMGGKASAASKSKKKPTAKRKKRSLHSVRGGGEEFEVLGTIDAIQGLQP